MSDQDILLEVRKHLDRAAEWADPNDLDISGKWSPIQSTLDAVNEGNVGLALTRWDDLLYSPNRPELSQAALNWLPNFEKLNINSIEQAMDLLTFGAKTEEDVVAILGKEIVIAAKKKLDDLYGDDHIPWYAKKWN